MTKKKILHVTQALGGVKTYLEHIFNFSDNSSVEYVLIAPEDVEFRDFCNKRKVTYHAVDITRGINPFNDILSLIKIIRIIKKEKPGLIHTHSAKGGFLGRLASRFCKRNVIYTPHAFSFLPFTGFKRMMFYLLESIAKKWTTVILAVSNSEAQRAVFELGFPSEKVEVVMNSIPINATRVREDFTRAVNVGMIGRLTYQKNPILFLQIARNLLHQYPKIQFTILGAGLHDHLIEEINTYMATHKLEGKVILLSWGDHLKSSNFLDNTDIYVMTSVFEGLPYSLLEAMAKGIPCVVSKSDGNSDVIQNNDNGYACTTAEEFSNKIELLLQNEACRRKIGLAGYEYVKQHHEVKNAVFQIQSIYNKFYDPKYLIEIDNELFSNKESKIRNLYNPSR